MRALFIEHHERSVAGPIWRAFEARGYQIERFLVVPDDKSANPNITVEFPDFSQYDIIVPMGAPFGVFEVDRIGNWLLPELELLKQAHNAGQPIFGVCFGGQLMAKALGGSVSRAPQPEVGWNSVESNNTSLISTGPWLDYHWDRWVSPPLAQEIAKTDLAVQAFTLGRTLGLQFHPEVTIDVLNEWLTMNGGCVEVEALGVDVEALRAQTIEMKDQIEKNAIELVNAFLDQVAIANVQQVG